MYRYKVIDVDDVDGVEGCEELERKLDEWEDFDLVTMVRRPGHMLRLVLRDGK